MQSQYSYTLKCHYDQILNIHFFYSFVHSKSVLEILPNFNYFWEFTAAENCTKIRAKFFVILYENFSTNCYCNFNPCGIFEKMMSFTQIFN